MNRIPVFYPAGQLAYFANADEVRLQKRSGVLETYGTKQKIHRAVLMAGPARPVAGTKYVHNHYVSEYFTDDEGRVHDRDPMDPNPPGVYTLRRIDSRDRSLFMTAVTDCLI
jgi:hypothetical protein